VGVFIRLPRRALPKRPPVALGSDLAANRRSGDAGPDQPSCLCDEISRATLKIYPTASCTNQHSDEQHVPGRVVATVI
jgi:hypothetical protein